MKDKDFRQLVDHEFAQLNWTDRQRMDTLRKMQKEERPVMKRKLSVVLVAAMLLLTLTGTAVAAGLNVYSLQDFFDQWFADENISDGFPTPIIDEAFIVTPVSQRHTSALVSVQVEQLYLSHEALYFTISYTPKAANTLLFGTGLTSIELDGEEKDYWDLWNYEELSLLSPGSVCIDDLRGRQTPLSLITRQRYRNPETGAITEMYILRDEKALTQLRAISGGTLMLRFTVDNLRNHDTEYNVLYIDFPRIETVEKDPLDFTE